MLYHIDNGTIGTIVVKKLTIALASLAFFLAGSVAGSAELLPGEQSFHNVTQLTSESTGIRDWRKQSIKRGAKVSLFCGYTCWVICLALLEVLAIA